MAKGIHHNKGRTLVPKNKYQGQMMKGLHRHLKRLKRKGVGHSK